MHRKERDVKLRLIQSKTGKRLINIEQIVSITKQSGKMYRIVLTGNVIIPDVPKEEIDALIKEGSHSSTEEEWQRMSQ